MFYNLLVFNPIFSFARALSYAYSTFTAIFNSFLLAYCVILAETVDLLGICKIDCTIFTKNGLSIISLLLLDQFLTTKRHSSDV